MVESQWKDHDSTMRLRFSANIVKNLIFVNYNEQNGANGPAAKLLIPLANGLVYLLH
jgi:hypothetical protein